MTRISPTLIATPIRRRRSGFLFAPLAARAMPGPAPAGAAAPALASPALASPALAVPAAPALAAPALASPEVPLSGTSGARAFYGVSHTTIVPRPAGPCLPPLG